MLSAAPDEYVEHGWAGFTVDGVARRAGVGKSTVYLRWRDKDALVTDALRRRRSPLADPDTGSLRGDLTGLTIAVFRDYTDPEAWAGFRMILDSANASGPHGHFTEETIGRHRQVIAAIFARALERGEVTARVRPVIVTHLIYGAGLCLELARRFQDKPRTEEEIAASAAEVVEVLLGGLERPGIGDDPSEI